MADAVLELIEEAKPAGIAVLTAMLAKELPPPPAEVSENAWQIHFVVFSLAVVDSLVMLGLDLPQGIEHLDQVREYLKRVWGYEDEEISRLRKLASSQLKALTGVPQISRKQALGIRDHLDVVVMDLRKCAHLCCVFDTAFAMKTPQSANVAARLDGYMSRQGSQLEMDHVLQVAGELMRRRPQPTFDFDLDLTAERYEASRRQVAEGRARSIDEVRRDLGATPPLGG